MVFSSMNEYVRVSFHGERGKVVDTFEFGAYLEEGQCIGFSARETVCLTANNKRRLRNKKQRNKNCY